MSVTTEQNVHRSYLDGYSLNKMHNWSNFYRSIYVDCLPSIGHSLMSILQLPELDMAMKSPHICMCSFSNIRLFYGWSPGKRWYCFGSTLTLAIIICVAGFTLIYQIKPPVSLTKFLLRLSLDISVEIDLCWVSWRHTCLLLLFLNHQHIPLKIINHSFLFINQSHPRLS